MSANAILKHDYDAPFSIGELVRCVVSNRQLKRTFGLIEGKTYTVEYCPAHDKVRLEGINETFDAARFELAKKPAELKQETKEVEYILTVGDYVNYEGKKTLIVQISEREQIYHQGSYWVYDNNTEPKKVKYALLKGGHEIELAKAVPWIEPTYNWSNLCEDLWDKYTLD